MKKTYLPHMVLRFKPSSSFHSSESAILLALAVSVGLTSGIGIWIFTTAVEQFTHLFKTDVAQNILEQWFGSWGIVITLALVGWIVGALMQRFVGEERHHGVAGIIEAVAMGGGRLRYRRMPFKALAAALSLGAGASVGPEDPSVQIGANLGSFFGQYLRLSEERIQLLVAAGAASAIAAAFRAPLAGVFFALEVILNGEFVTSSFGVVVLSAVTSSVFTQAIAGTEPEIGILTYTLGNPLEIPFYVLLGLLLGPVAALFTRAVYWQHDFWHNHISLSRPMKTAFAGVLVGIAALFVPEIMGAGRETMAEVLSGKDVEFTFGLLLLIGTTKLLMTPVSLAGGFQGGIFAPSLFVGTMFGGAFGRLIHEIGPTHITGDPQAYAIAGMAAVMAGVVHAPITAILLVFELTNDYRLILPIMLTTVVCIWVAERFEPSGIYVLGLLRKGIHLQHGHDVDIMQSVTVAEAMTTPAPTIAETASLQELRDQFRAHNTRSLCVINIEGQLVGIVTLTDLQRAYEAGHSRNQCVADICTQDVITATPDDVLWKAIRLMGKRSIGRLPVVKPGTRELVGILRRHDLVQAYNLGISRKREHQYLVEQIRLNSLTNAHVFEVSVTDQSSVISQRIRDIPWPSDSIVASVRRDGRLIVPHGETTIKAGDRLIVVAVPELEKELVSLING